MANSDDGPNEPEVTYFKDFIHRLEQDYAWASVQAIIDELDYVNLVGAAIAGLKERQDGVLIMRVPIGHGDYAYIELEYDRSQVLRPVMGGVLKG